MLDEAIRVPWIIRYPAVLKPRHTNFLARSVDVAPTLLDFAGLLGKRSLDGVSLRAALVDKKATTGTTLYYRYYDEAMKARVTPPAPPSHVGIRTGRWKLILFDGLRCTPGFRTSGPIFALYDLERDPREATDVYASTSAKIASKLKRELRAAMASVGGESHVKAGAHLPPDCLQLVCARVPFRRHRRDYPSSTPSTRPLLSLTGLRNAGLRRVPPDNAVRDASHDCRGLGEGAPRAHRCGASQVAGASQEQAVARGSHIRQRRQAPRGRLPPPGRGSRAHSRGGRGGRTFARRPRRWLAS